MNFIEKVFKLGLIFTVLGSIWALVKRLLIIGILIIFYIMYTHPTDAVSNPIRDGLTVPTYEQLRDYPVDCKLKDSQLADLYRIQKIKNFAEDPDDLNDQDRQYNARLKATIWWFAYGCEK